VGIPISRQELFESPEVVGWLNQVTEEIIRDLSGALSTLGVEQRIDTLLLSGRTAELPVLRSRLMESLRRYLNLDDASCKSPQLSSNEKKEAVALGLLLYGIHHTQDLRVVDQNVWAKYGLIYETGIGPRFQRFFGYDTPPEATDETIDEHGLITTLFRRTHEINRSGGPVQIAATFSSNPDVDLRSGRDKFIPIFTLGQADVGLPGKVRIKMSNERDNQITVVVNPGQDETEISVPGHRENGYLAQLEWPYQPLRRAPSVGAPS
jgi:hypothetical protein